MTNHNDIRISNQFCAFCTRVLKNETRNIFAEYKRRLEHEKSTDDLSAAELLQLSSEDNYFSNDEMFLVLNDTEIVVSNNTLAKALKQLPANKRDIILLS